MKMSGNAILITGGATGLGFELAEMLSDLGNDVMICGRREEKLEKASARIPGIKTLRCDISKESDRDALLAKVEREFNDINMLINNAGIQRKIDFNRGSAELRQNDGEIDINFKAAVGMCAGFIPLLSRKDSAIVNVSSGLGFVPMAAFPIYSATKAAMHSFTMSLRYQLRNSTIKVFEVIPPTLYDTELKGMPIQKTDYSISAKEMAAEAVKGFSEDRFEISAGQAKRWTSESKNELDQEFRNINH